MKLLDGLVTMMLASIILVLSIVFNMECISPTSLSSCPPFNNCTVSPGNLTAPVYSDQAKITDAEVQASAKHYINESLKACNDFYSGNLKICFQNLRLNCFPKPKSESRELVGSKMLEGKALTDVFPNIKNIGLSLPLRKKDATLIDSLISKSLVQDAKTDAFFQFNTILDIFKQLNTIHEDIDTCINALESDLDHKDYPLTNDYLGEKVYNNIALLLSKVEWNYYKEEKNEILDVIIRLGFSLDSKIKKCWERYQTNTDDSVQDLDLTYCFEYYMYGLCLSELIDKLNLRSGTDTNAGNRSRRAIIKADSQHIARNDEEMERRKGYPDSVILSKISTTSSELVTGDTFVNEQPGNRNEVKEGLHKRSKND